MPQVGIAPGGRVSSSAIGLSSQPALDHGSASFLQAILFSTLWERPLPIHPIGCGKLFDAAVVLLGIMVSASPVEDRHGRVQLR